MEIASTPPQTKISSVVALPANSTTAKPKPASANATPAPAKDQVSISPQAYEKLAAESNAAPAPQDSQPSETRKFIHGALGLERPTDTTETLPQDSYGYGRFASALITAAALIALV